MLHALLSRNLGDRVIDGKPRYQWAPLAGDEIGDKWWLRVRPSAVDRQSVESMGAFLIRQVPVPEKGETLHYAVDYTTNPKGGIAAAPGLMLADLERKARAILGEAFDLSGPGAFVAEQGKRCHTLSKQRGMVMPRMFLRCEGIAPVRDPERLSYFLERGLGRARGYGFGLLVVQQPMNEAA